MEKVIEITAKREGFWRCGIAHSETTRTYPGDFFKPSVLKALQEEPMLIVVVRNKADAEGSASTGDQLQALLDAERNKVSALTLQLEDERKNVTTLTTQLEGERTTVITLTTQLEDERKTVGTLTTQLEDERKSVTTLTTQLEAATKKGK